VRRKGEAYLARLNAHQHRGKIILRGETVSRPERGPFKLGGEQRTGLRCGRKADLRYE